MYFKIILPYFSISDSDCGSKNYKILHTEKEAPQWHTGNAQKWKKGGARFKTRSRLSTSRSEFSMVFSETRVNTG